MPQSSRPTFSRPPLQTNDDAGPYQGVPYERRLDRDFSWALMEGSRFFEGGGAVQEALRRIARHLNEFGVDYAIAGGMALYFHGLRRFTEIIELIVSADLKVILRELEGLGYLPSFSGSRHLRDTRSGVKIEFLVAGQFPGDGKPKEVSFPDPRGRTVESNGIRYLNLPTLIELKVASGMTNALRMRDLADVLELIRILNLPEDFVDKLNLSVREKFHELWSAVHSAVGDELESMDSFDKD